jgi:NAD(P)H-hydrate epimerase
MQPILTAEEMRRCDETTIRKGGIPGLLLMENAGRGIADVVVHACHPMQQKRIVVCCGKGNNGGDGFVVARLLANYVSGLTVLLLASPSELKGDAAKNYEILLQLSKILTKTISIRRFSKKAIQAVQRPDLIIDAIFGTGFSGAARKPYSDCIEWINASGAEVIAVDIPSGVNGTTGVADGPAVHAQRTVTLASLKSGLLCNQGKEYSGRITVLDIGIPQQVVDTPDRAIRLVEREDVRNVLPKRSLNANKYTVGKVFVLAGSKGLTGAAALTSLSALRMGAGAVLLGTPDSIYPILAGKLTEAMVLPLPSSPEGGLGLKSLEIILEKIKWADVVVIGPGLGQQKETQEVVLKTLLESRGKVLLDADGLNAVARNGISKLRALRSEIILTPHTGEFSRLTNLLAKEIEEKRFSAARELAEKIRATIVLKGAPTAVTSADGFVYCNSTGNPGMATAGSGDVLSGIIAGIWAQGASAIEAAYAGVYIHGLSGDRAAARLGEKSLVAHDLIDYLGETINSIESGRSE